MTNTAAGEVELATLRLAKELGVDENIRHHVGHAIGLEGHEAPFLDRGDEAVKCYDRFLLYDLPEEDQARYSKDAVRQRAEELTMEGSRLREPGNRNRLPASET